MQWKNKLSEKNETIFFLYIIINKDIYYLNLEHFFNGEEEENLKINLKLKSNQLLAQIKTNIIYFIILIIHAFK